LPTFLGRRAAIVEHGGINPTELLKRRKERKSLNQMFYNFF
jgi:hypothetical protein